MCIFSVSRAEIMASPELFVRSGSDINLTCVVKHTPDPPRYVIYYRIEKNVLHKHYEDRIYNIKFSNYKFVIQPIHNGF